MEVLDISMLDLGEIRRILGGTGTDTSNFIICNDVYWGDQVPTGDPYRANAAALILCTRGSMQLSIGVRRHHLHENTVMLYGPGNIIEVHERTPDFRANIMFFTRDFTKSALLDLQAVMPIYKYLTEEAKDFLHAELEEVKLINNYFALITEVCEGKYGEGAVFNLLASMFRTVSEMYGKRIAQEPPGTKPRSRQEEYFERFLVEVSKSHKEERSVQYYADVLHITPKYLSTVIKEVSGRSAAEWIDEFVVQEAKVLLKYSPKSIQEITYHLNFSTQSFFGKYFKRHVGVSPSQYRNGK